MAAKIILISVLSNMSKNVFYFFSICSPPYREGVFLFLLALLYSPLSTPPTTRHSYSGGGSPPLNTGEEFLIVLLA